MARLCERPGCSAPASVAYGFEARATTVWVAAFEPYELCDESESDLADILDREVDGLIVAQFEMQERVMLDGAPVAAE